MVERYITTQGEFETAIRLKEGVTLADDFIGGSSHGDEVLTSFISLIDGVKLDTTIASSGSTQKIEFIQKSEGFAPAGLTYAGTKVLDITKRWEFNKGAPNQLSNKIAWVYNVELQDTYLLMIPIKRTDSLGQITDTFIVSDEYTEVDVSSSGHTNPYYQLVNMGGEVRIWSDTSKISATVNILSGWGDLNASEFNVSPSVSYNKLYFDTSKTSSALIGDTTTLVSEFDILSS